MLLPSGMFYGHSPKHHMDHITSVLQQPDKAEIILEMGQ